MLCGNLGAPAELQHWSKGQSRQQPQQQLCINEGQSEPAQTAEDQTESARDCCGLIGFSLRQQRTYQMVCNYLPVCNYRASQKHLRANQSQLGYFRGAAVFSSGIWHLSQ